MHYLLSFIGKSFENRENVYATQYATLNLLCNSALWNYVFFELIFKMNKDAKPSVNDFFKIINNNYLSIFVI